MINNVLKQKICLISCCSSTSPWYSENIPHTLESIWWQSVHVCVCTMANSFSLIRSTLWSFRSVCLFGGTKAGKPHESCHVWVPIVNFICFPFPLFPLLLLVRLGLLFLETHATKLLFCTKISAADVVMHSINKPLYQKHQILAITVHFKLLTLL